MIRRVSGFVVAMLVLAIFATQAHANRRVALVVGNNDYTDVPKLEKAAGDARAISTMLTGLGFDVITILDANRQRMSRALVDLETRVSPGDTVLFYFAGHGVALDGGNLLLPTDIPSVTEAQRNLLRTEGFLADDISERIQARGAATTVMVLDACRNNPFKAGPGRSIGQTRGLSRMDTRRGMFVMFSAGAGQEALDRLGPNDRHPNSVFTRLFVELVKRPDLDLIDVAKELQVEVPKLARSVGHEQLPAYYDQIPGRIFLARADGSAPPARPKSAPSSRLALALVTDDPAMASGAPLREYGNANSTYRIERDITFPGDIERFDAILDQRRLPAINIAIASEALDRINGGAGIVGRQIALVLDGRTVLSAAKIMEPLSRNLMLSGNFSWQDIKRLVDAIAANPSGTR